MRPDARQCLRTVARLPNRPSSARPWGEVQCLLFPPFSIFPMPSLLTSDGLRLHTEHWAPDASPRGTALLVHGLGEHIGRYPHVIARLRADGWAVWGYDQRGHGRSPGRRGAIAAADSLLADLGAMIAEVRRADPGPLLLLGHSLGGLVVARYVAEGLAVRPAPWWQPVQALVMSSPALDPGMSAGQKRLLAVLGALAPWLAVGNGLDPAWISRDPAVVQAYIADPRVHDRVTPRLVRWIVDAGALVRERAARWQTPTLLMWAGADRCVAPAGSAAFAAAAPATVLTSQVFTTLYHEIFNEPERAEPLAQLTRWLARFSQEIRP